MLKIHYEVSMKNKYKNVYNLKKNFFFLKIFMASKYSSNFVKKLSLQIAHNS